MPKRQLLAANVLTPDMPLDAARALRGVGLTDNFALLTVREAAAFLSMSEAWLYQSDVPFVRIDRARRYRRIDLIAYTEQRMSRAVQVVSG